MLSDIYGIGIIISAILFWKFVVKLLFVSQEKVDFVDVIGMAISSLAVGLAWPLVAISFLIFIVANVYAKNFNEKIKNER